MKYIVEVREPVPSNLDEIAGKVAASFHISDDKALALLKRAPGAVTRAVSEREADVVAGIFERAGLNVVKRPAGAVPPAPSASTPEAPASDAGAESAPGSAAGVHDAGASEMDAGAHEDAAPQDDVWNRPVEAAPETPVDAFSRREGLDEGGDLGWTASEGSRVAADRADPDTADADRLGAERLDADRAAADRAGAERADAEPGGGLSPEAQMSVGDEDSSAAAGDGSGLEGGAYDEGIDLEDDVRAGPPEADTPDTPDTRAKHPLAGEAPGADAAGSEVGARAGGAAVADAAGAEGVAGAVGAEGAVSPREAAAVRRSQTPETVRRSQTPETLRSTLTRVPATLERGGLRRRVALSSILPALLTLVVMGVAMLVTTVPLLRSQQAARAADAAHAEASTLEALTGGMPLDALTLQSALVDLSRRSEAMLGNGGVRSMVVTDATGAPLAGWYGPATTPAAMPPDVRQQVSGAALSAVAGQGQVGENLTQSLRATWTSTLAMLGLGAANDVYGAAPVMSAGHAIGAVVVGVEPVSASALVGNAFLTTLLVGLVPVLIAILVALALTRGLRSQVTYLLGAADRISRGDLEEPVGLDSNDELGQLARAIERMRVSLQEGMERLRNRR